MPALVSLKPTLNKVWVDKLLQKVAGSDTTTATITPVLHLLGGTPPVINQARVLADFTAAEAVFSNYGAVTPPMSAPAVAGPNADSVLMEGNFIGHSTGTFTPDTVTGYYLAFGGIWIMAEVFDPTLYVAINAEGVWVDVTALLPVSLIPSFV